MSDVPQFIPSQLKSTFRALQIDSKAGANSAFLLVNSIGYEFLEKNKEKPEELLPTVTKEKIKHIAKQAYLLNNEMMSDASMDIYKQRRYVIRAETTVSAIEGVFAGLETILVPGLVFKVSAFTGFDDVMRTFYGARSFLVDTLQALDGLLDTSVGSSSP